LINFQLTERPLSMKADVQNRAAEIQRLKSPPESRHSANITETGCYWPEADNTRLTRTRILCTGRKAVLRSIAVVCWGAPVVRWPPRWSGTWEVAGASRPCSLKWERQRA